MATILLIDDALFCRELVGKALRQEGYQVITAVNGLEGLAALKRSAVDLVVLDNEMPLMDGHAFLLKLRENPKWIRLPVIMLTGVGQKEKVLEAIQSGAVDYLLKSEFTVSKLIERIRKRLSNSLSDGGATAAHIPVSVSAETAVVSPASSVPKSSEARPIPSRREQVIAAIESIDDARTLGGVVSRVLAIANSPRAGLRDLVQVVQQDPVLASRTLRLANSVAVAGHRPPATNLEDAIRQTGASAVRTLAMSIGVFETLSSDGAFDLGLIRCWQHGLAVANLMDQLSTDGNTSCDPGISHLVGLCHDLGEILLRQRFPEAFVDAEKKALSSGVFVLRALPAIFGISYDEVTERLLTKLCLPVTISKPILEHARREAGKASSFTTPISRALSLADRYANGLLFASSVTALVSPIQLDEYPDARPIDKDSLRQEVLAAICAMAKLAPAQEEKLLSPLLPRQSHHLLYVRDRCLSEFDPMENALKAICDVETIDPTSALEKQRTAEANLVVVSPRLDTPPYSSLAKRHSESPHLNKGLGLFLIGNATHTGLPSGGSNGCHQYPISLYALNGFLEQSLVRQSAA